jgi:hypothetical protein
MKPTSLLAGACLALLLPLACRHEPPAPEAGGGTMVLGTAAGPEPVVPVMPEEVVVGRVVLVGANTAFVVMQLEAGAEVAQGDELDVRFAGTSVGKVRVDAKKPEYPKLLTADVLSGTAEKGYEIVRVTLAQAPAPAPQTPAP